MDGTLVRKAASPSLEMGPNLLRKGNLDRFQVNNPTYPEILALYYKMRSSIWYEKEIVLTQDADDFATLSPAEKHMLLVPLMFFFTADGAVNENISINFASEVEYGEARLMYGVQTMIEGVHQIVYGLLLRTYVRARDELDKLLHAAETMPCVALKMDWAFKYMNAELSFARRMFGFGIMEGFFFQSSFAIIFWFKRGTQFQGLIKSNVLISRDEYMHVQAAALLYSKLWASQRLTQAEAYEMMDAALVVEEAFVRAAIPEPLTGINATMMMQFVRECANKVLVMFGYAKRYLDARNPFEWLDMINLDTKTNFFEHREANYSQHTGGPKRLRSSAAAPVGGLKRQRSSVADPAGPKRQRSSSTELPDDDGDEDSTSGSDC